VKWLEVYESVTHEFNSLTMTSLGLSYSDDFYGYYKIAGFSLYRNSKLFRISRDTYGALSLIGDIGGIFDGFSIIGLALSSLFVG
jgi:hypothetical protein